MSLHPRLLIVLASFLVWITVIMLWVTGHRLMGDPLHSRLLDIPAGIHMFVVLVCGIWGAIGIALANLGSLLFEQNQAHAAEEVVFVVVSAFAPLMGLRLASSMLGISTDLHNLKPLHLPVLALFAALASALLLGAVTFSFGGRAQGDQLAYAAGMTASAFAGTLVVMVVILITTKLFRWMRPQRATPPA